MKYVRTNGGRTVHIAGCPQLQYRKNYPWAWAEDISLEDLVTVMERSGYRACGKCKPLGDR